MVWKTSRLEAVLDGPRDPTWFLFEHVAPMLEVFLRTGKVVSLETALADEAAAQGISASTFIHDRQEAAVAALDAYLVEAVPHMYSAARFFARQQKPAKCQLFDNHCFTTYGDYMDAVSKHAANIRKSTQRFPSDTIEALNITANYDYWRTGMRLNKQVHLGFRHGSPALDVNFPVVFQISRIKNPIRFGNKCARYICEGLQELSSFTAQLTNSSQPDRISSKVREAFGGMRYFGFSTPFSEDHTLDPMEFLFVRSRVSDLCGVFYVTRTEDEARMLLNSLVTTRFAAAAQYKVLSGYRLKKVEQQWGFESEPLIDDHYVTGSRELAKANQNIFLYIVPQRISAYDSRVDFGISHLAGYYRDLPPHEGSHILYETRQDAKVNTWERQYSLLYTYLCEEISFITDRINVQKHDLYPLELFPTTSVASDLGAFAK